MQGDIVGLLDSTGALVVEYKYDAWGKPISTTGNLADTLGKRNPFRYRGYVYDEETGLYYLRSRYYNPGIGRFVNADSVIKARSLFTYCSNSPMNFGDWNGAEESKSDSSGDITNFMREGFWCVFIDKPVVYNPLLCQQVKENTAIMYIPYQDIQYYNNALYFATDNPVDVIKGAVVDNAVSTGRDTITDAASKALGVGNIFGIIFDVLEIADKYHESLVEKIQNENHKEAQQLATNRKTGLIVVITQTKVWRWLKDVTHPRGGYYLGPQTTQKVKYYESTDYFKR